MPADDQLAGRIVVITGAARGVGEATARLLSARRALVALGDIDYDDARNVAAELCGAVAYPVDVRDGDSLASLLEAAETELGPVDVMINNAAVMALAPFLDVADDRIRTQVETNLMGVIYGMRATLPKMLARGRGHVINMNSAAGYWGVPGENAYVATKFATRGISDVARRELRGSGVRVSTVHFGPATQTELALGMRPSRLVRMVTREQVARAVAALIERPRAEVWVPAYTGWLYATTQLLPRPIRDRIERLSGLERVATDVVRAERDPYEDRAFSRSRIAPN